MTTPTFPTLSQARWSKYFSVAQEDPVVSSTMEGGYVVTRPRFTRRPRKTYGDGYTYLNEVDRTSLMAFWDTVQGGSLYFNWTHPTTQQQILVRFKGVITWKYIGAGSNYRWEANFMVEEV